jgi:hypothetical protein
MRHTLVGLLLVLPLTVMAKEIVFEGYPVKKIELSETASQTSLLTDAQSAEYKVAITKDGDNYYWTSRADVQLVRTVSGAYVTYVAVNGAGYIRALVPSTRELFMLLPKEEQATSYLYAEHLLFGMGSLTYYGR